MVDKIAAALGERGIGAGDVVGLFAPNSPEWAAVFHGVLRANAIVTSANSLYTPGELAHQLADSGAKLLVTVSPFLDRARAALAEAGLPEDAVVTLDAAPGVTSLADLLATTAAPPELTTTAADTAVLPYSSGTTGPGQGRDPHAPQPRREPLPDRGDGPRHVRDDDPRRAAVLPHLRHDRDDEPWPAQARHRGDDAEVRPRRVPAGDRRVPRPPGLHRAAGGRRAGQAPDRRRLRPLVHRHHLLRRRAAGRRAGPRDGQAPGLHGAAGLRDDGAVAGEPLHARRPPRPGPQLVGLRAAERRVQAGRPGDRRGGRPRRAGRAVGARARTSCRAT